MSRACARGTAVAAVALVWILAPRATRAQAWVSDPGDGTIALSTQYVRVMKHLFSVDVAGQVEPGTGYLLGPGNQGYFGDITEYSSSVSGEYVPVRHLAVTADAMHVVARYKGLSPESPFDNGDFHGDLQDMGLGARYMVRRGILVVTPSVDVRFPLTNYNVIGHSAAGTGLKSATFGLNTGLSLESLVRSAYAFANYARTITENVDGYSLDHNMVTAGAGLFLTRLLSVQAQFQYLDTTDGIDWWWADPVNHLHHQTVAAKALYRRVGASAGYSVGKRYSLALSWESTLSGANVHATHSLTLGASCSFWKRRTY